MAEITTLFNNYQVPFPTVEELPANDATRAGACFFYENQLWTFLPDGRPWPAKGYKEYVAFVRTPNAQVDTVTVIKNDTNLVVDLELSATGQFDIIATGEDFDENTVIDITNSISLATSLARVVLQNTNPDRNPNVPMRILTQSGTTPTDGLLSNILTIRIYPS
jgi:hypothetical protein